MSFLRCSTLLFALGIAFAPLAAAAQVAPVPVATPAPLPTPQSVGGPSSQSVGGPSSQIRPMPVPRAAYPANGRAPTLTLQGSGFVLRAADRAVGRISITATSATAELALAAVSNIASGLQKTLEHIRGTRVSEASASIMAYNYNGDASPLNGSAQLDITIDDLTSLPAIRGAVASTPGATLGDVRYDVRDRESAYAAAIAAALADVRAQAAALAAKTSLQLGRQRSFQAYVQPRDENNGEPTARIDATATITYEVSPPS
jgi:uncharacterized protein YggE